MARMPGVTDCTRVYNGAPASVHNLTYAIPRAQPAHHLWGVGNHICCHTRCSVRLAPTVRGGVLDAPWLRDCRAALDAPAQRDQTHPRHQRCARLASTTQRMKSRGHSPRTFFTGAPTLFIPPTPGGRGSPPLRRVGASASHPRRHQPLSHGPLGRDSSPFRGADGVGTAHPRYPSAHAGRAVYFAWISIYSALSLEYIIFWLR